MYVIFVLIIIVPIALFFGKRIMRKLGIQKPTVSRAKVLHKRAWNGSDIPNAYIMFREIAPKKEYFATFAYMDQNTWGEHEFSVPQKAYEALSVGSEGILKHHYTEFVDFEVLQK